MEVGDQGIHRLEFVAGIDENTRIGVHGVDDALLVRGAFQGTAGGSAHADHTPARGAALVDDAGRLGGDREELGVHDVVGDGVLLHGTEGTQAHVEHDGGDGHTLIPEGLQKLGGEVESRRGGCRRALGLGVDRLVAVAVGQPLGNVGGEGHEADLVEDVVYVLVSLAVKVELDEAVALLYHVHYLSRQHSLAEHHAVARAGSLTGLDQALPGVGSPLAEQQQLDPRFGPALGVAVEAGGDDLGVVDDQDVLGSDVVENIEKVLVVNGFRFSVQYHEAGVIPQLLGVLGDELLGKMVEEVRRPQIRLGAVVYDEFVAHVCSFHVTAAVASRRYSAYTDSRRETSPPFRTPHTPSFYYTLKSPKLQRVLQIFSNRYIL